MIKMRLALAASLLASVLSLHAGNISKYNVVWDSPSKDSFESMPLSGIRGAGANVWMQDGSVWIYLAHNGAYDDAESLVKLGALCVTPVGVDFKTPKSFRQELDLPTGSIRIAAEAQDGTHLSFNLQFLGETLVIESQQDKEIALKVEFASWRAKPDAPVKATEHVQINNGQLRFVHRNGKRESAMNTAKSQGIPPEAIPNPLAERVFGCVLAAQGGLSFEPAVSFQSQKWIGYAWPATTVAGKSQVVVVALGAAKKADPESWQTRANELLVPKALVDARLAEKKRWDEFWNRSHVAVQPDGKSDDPAFQIGRNYQCFRYMSACNQGGELPLKFNGGIFTVEPSKSRVLPHLSGVGSRIPETSDPDYRRWGSIFFGQNQRWIGWPSVANGDADVLAISSAFYRDRLPVARARAHNLKAEGACYIEALDIEGLCNVYPNGQSMSKAAHLDYHFSMGLEHAWITLLGHGVLGTDIRGDVTWMVEQVRFFDSFYRLQTKERTGKEYSDSGKLVLYPLSGLEFALKATDAIETVAGLRRVTEGLLALKELPQSDRDFLSAVQKTLPELPVAVCNGKKTLQPAAKWEAEANPWELPEMYAAWPYRFVGVTQPETLQLARDTWDSIPNRGDQRNTICKVDDLSWMPNVAYTASLAWPEESKKRAITKLSNLAGSMRFPAFFGPGHDWMPDHNWGGAGTVGIQEMLLAPEPGPNGKLYLFPSWPADWDVDFKLHAPGQTIVEGVLKGGKLVSLKVTPKSRAKDVVNWLGKQPPFHSSKSLSQGKKVTTSSQFNQPGYEADKAVDGDCKTRWASEFAARSGWIQVDLGEEKEIRRVRLSEIEWPETREFAIEIKQGDAWKVVDRGTTIGKEKEIVFSPVKAQFVRLNLLKADRALNLNEFQVFAD